MNTLSILREYWEWPFRRGGIWNIYLFEVWILMCRSMPFSLICIPETSETFLHIRGEKKNKRLSGKIGNSVYN